MAKDNKAKKLLTYLTLDAIERARKSMLAFTLYTMPEYKVNWHHRNLCKKLDNFAAGKIQNLMVFMPPRHGKSQLVSRHFPAFLHGLYPHAHIMSASYLDSLASEMCKDVQKIMDSPEYLDVFPNTRLHKARSPYSVGSRSTTEHSIVGTRGRYTGQGVGGSFTGKGANYICFPSGVDISTPSGHTDISKIKVGDHVWTFNHARGLQEIKRIEVVYVNRVPGLVRVTTTRGREVLCTPDHPFYSTTRSEYRKAKDLIRDGLLVQTRVHEAPKDDRRPSLFTLWGSVRQAPVRVREVIAARTRRILLWVSLFSEPSRDKEPAQVFNLWQAGRAKDQKILFKCVQAEHGETQKNTMPGVCGRVQTWVSPLCDVFRELRRAVALSKDERALEPQMENGRGERWVPRLVRPASSSHNRTRRRGVRGVCVGDQTPGPSYQSRPNGERSKEPNHPMPNVSHDTPQIEGDAVYSVVQVSCDQVTVYDLKVEGNHNFFANGILAHNCIDDPIKGREIADSVAFRDRLWNFYNNDLFSRLETDLKTGKRGQVLITQTRWHEDDLSGRLLEVMHADPKAVQWDIVDYPAVRIDLDDPTDPREIGAALWPEKYDLAQLEQIRASAGPRAWSSLYQQRPVPAGGGLFSESMFEFVDIPDQFDWTFITADTAYKEKQENDFTVFTAFGVIGDRLYVRDVWSRQIKAVDVEAPAEGFIRRYMKYGYRGTYIEPKGHGIYLNQSFAMKGLMIPNESTLNEFYADRRFGKVERANNAVPHLAHRKVYISNSISNKEDLLAQCLLFPKVKHDDFVDTLVDGIKMVYAREIGILDVL